jgi:hypothetical protein
MTINDAAHRAPKMQLTDEELHVLRLIRCSDTGIGRNQKIDDLILRRLIDLKLTTGPSVSDLTEAGLAIVHFNAPTYRNKRPGGAEQ